MGLSLRPPRLSLSVQMTIKVAKLSEEIGSRGQSRLPLERAECKHGHVPESVLTFRYVHRGSLGTHSLPEKRSPKGN